MSHADHYFYSADGRLLGSISNMAGTGSRALNRVVGTSAEIAADPT